MYSIYIYIRIKNSLNLYIEINTILNFYTVLKLRIVYIYIYNIKKKIFSFLIRRKRAIKNLEIILRNLLTNILRGAIMAT